MKGGARLMVGFHGRRPDPAFRDLLLETGARSVILFARNLDDAAQARDLIAEVRSLVPWPLVVAVDQEGGAVVRITKGATVFPGNMALGAAGDPALALEAGRESGRQLAGMGFDLNLAPVVDLQTNPANPGIGIRSFGSTLEGALPLARAFIDGHREAGVHCCLKHFPGKGAAGVDAHLDLPVLDLAEEEFRRPHLAIFEALLRETDLAVMSTHLLVKGLDAERPATLSPLVIRGLLRERMGFRGLVITDCLEMGAIVKHWGVAEAARLAVVAGHDLVPVCHTAERQRGAAAAIEAGLASGDIDRSEHERAVLRIEALAAGSAGRAGLAPTGAGEAVADRIAGRSVHLFGDARRLLPIGPAHRVAVILARPTVMVAVEESVEGDWERTIRRHLSAAGIGVGAFRMVTLDGEDAPGAAGATDPEAIVGGLGGFDRLLLYGWNALGQPAMRDLLAAAVRAASDRLVVVHLRNPFDQRLLPRDVTALTAFGWRDRQLRVQAEVLAGKREALGRMPAAWA